MPVTYLSTFHTGFSDLIQDILPKSLKDVRITLVLDGLIIYTTSATVNHIRQLRFFNNSFILLAQTKNLSKDPIRSIAIEAIKTKNIAQIYTTHLPAKPATFRLRMINQSQPAALDRHLLQQLEDHISHPRYLRPNRTNPQYEFWCLVRREGYGFFALRITRNPDYEKTLAKGQIRPELANLLCQLSHPSAKDVFLDPFAGSGAIPFERAAIMPAHRLLASDNNPALVAAMQQAAKAIKHPITIQTLDALHTQLPAHSITKIVTDPPWGIFDHTLDAPHLYHHFLTEAARLLKSPGRLVILTTQSQSLDTTIKTHPAFSLIASYTTLVSGKKAAIYVLIPA